jgi:4-deoxy-L-threo-5-hexosulose-uronate ketol-isomerase
MQTRFSPGIHDYSKLQTEQIRQAYLVDTLFAPGELRLVYSDADRAIIGSAVPLKDAVELRADAELRASFFCERRELGVLNIGGKGAVLADGKRFETSKLDCVYLGRGTREVKFLSDDPQNSAAFYLISYPAHAQHPSAHADWTKAASVELGTVADANRRTIYKYIHADGIKSCQLVMGFTKLQDGAVWNTMPPHTHTRRSEVYLYFDLPGHRRVMHFMGTPQETRHVVMANRQAIISPSWSIHCGCGTGAYSFCWAMGGENQAFDDMDPAPLAELR